MIVVPMKLVSARDGSVTVLCRLTITNDGTGTSTRGNYDWKLEGKGGRVIKSGHLKNWPRQAKSPGQLLHRVMCEAYGDTS